MGRRRVLPVTRLGGEQGSELRLPVCCILAVHKVANIGYLLKGDTFSKFYPINVLHKLTVPSQCPACTSPEPSANIVHEAVTAADGAPPELAQVQQPATAAAADVLVGVYAALMAVVLLAAAANMQHTGSSRVVMQHT